MNNLKRDRFELLSAYLDGEVTAVERRQVEDWLEHDPPTRCLYERLLKLRHSMRMIPVPQPEQPATQAATQIFHRLNRRKQMVTMWGSLAIASLLLGLSSNLFPSKQVPVADRYANSESVASDALMIALDRPVIEIPKAPVSPPLVQGQFPLRSAEETP